MNCNFCGKETSNPKFCSRSCAAKSNNSKYPKRSLQRYCTKENCDNLPKSHRHTLCEYHFDEYQEWKRENLKNKTIGEYRNRDSVKGKHQSWLHSGVRALNRNWNKELLLEPCANCGYNKHVELAHIKPLSLFPNNSLLCEVNAKENNIQLCPNCHWEFDNKLISIEDIKNKYGSI